MAEKVSEYFDTNVWSIMLIDLFQILRAALRINRDNLSSISAFLLLERVPLDIILDMFRVPLLHNIKHCVLRQFRCTHVRRQAV